MKTEQQLASQAASLRAGVFATVMLVIVCFGAAVACSDTLANSAAQKADSAKISHSDVVHASN